MVGSLSSRRAWIEIPFVGAVPLKRYASLSSRRAWIEILFADVSGSGFASRSPHGERGLKSMPEAVEKIIN